jgi:Mg-chelatase subunit ChlD
MPFQIGSYKPPSSVDAKAAAIAAAKAASGAKPDALVRYISPDKCTDRIRVVFDDSGSMDSQIGNAKEGVVEFLRNCIPNQTAVAVHFMNTHNQLQSLRSDLPQLGLDIKEADLSSGGTPFFNTLKNALNATPTLTRLVAFTDGSPTDRLQAEDDEKASIEDYYSDQIDAWKSSADVIIKIAHAVAPASGCIPIDTVYFGRGSDYKHHQMDLLRYLSEQTGGYFLHFDPAKVNFRTAFKYLAPINRLMLSSGSFRAAVESGEKA